MKYNVLKKQNNSSECIVCGVNSGLSLGARFYELDNHTVLSVCTPKDEHQSYPNRMHGGMITGLLDEVIGRAIQIDDKDMWGVTGEINVRFVKPVPLGEEIFAVGKIVKNGSRMFTGVGFIEDKSGNLLATGIAKYVKVPIDIITGEEGHLHDFWFNIDETTPECFDIKNMDCLDSIL